MQKTVRISPRLYINIKKLFIDLINMWKSRQSIHIQHGNFCVLNMQKFPFLSVTIRFFSNSTANSNKSRIFVRRFVDYDNNIVYT